MRDALLVCRIQRLGNLLCNRQRFIQGNRSMLQTFLKGFALHKLHDDAARRHRALFAYGR